MKNFSILLLPIIFLSGIPISDASDIDIARQGMAGVTRQLKDPESARFRNSYINGGYYCGEVNAKNSYGGYAGYARFVSIARTAIIEPGEYNGAFEKIWRQSCWAKQKIDAYNKKEAENLHHKKQQQLQAQKKKQQLEAQFDKEIERQRTELRKLAEEKNKEQSDSD